MTDCTNRSMNQSKCNCTYSCAKKGVCCECLHYHLSMQQLPACCFPNDVEATYDRSFRRFVQVYKHLIA